MAYRTIAYCVEEGCRCDDRRGVILYSGPSLEEAERAAEQAPPGYAVEIQPAEPPDNIVY